MIKIGITGQSGFIGSHLYNFLSIKKETTTLVSFKKEFFLQEKQLEAFVEKCDVIVHLAAVNRADNPDDTLYTNILLVKKLGQREQHYCCKNNYTECFWTFW